MLLNKETNPNFFSKENYISKKYFFRKIKCAAVIYIKFVLY